MLPSPQGFNDALNFQTARVFVGIGVFLFAIAAIAYFLGMIETVGTGLKTHPAVAATPNTV